MNSYEFYLFCVLFHEIFSPAMEYDLLYSHICEVYERFCDYDHGKEDQYGLYTSIEKYLNDNKEEIIIILN